MQLKLGSAIYNIGFFILPKKHVFDLAPKTRLMIITFFYHKTSRTVSLRPIVTELRFTFIKIYLISQKYYFYCSDKTEATKKCFHIDFIFCTEVEINLKPSNVRQWWPHTTVIAFNNGTCGKKLLVIRSQNLYNSTKYYYFVYKIFFLIKINLVYVSLN